MKIYIADMLRAGLRQGGQLYNRMTPTEQAQRNSAAYRLEPFSDMYNPLNTEFIRNEGRPIFLAPGAADVDIKHFCRYVQSNLDLIARDESGIMLIGMPGAIVGNPLRAFERQRAMEAAGVRPLPYFQFGEDERYLQRYVADYPYISLGGLSYAPRPRVVAWLDTIWSRHLVDGAGRPKVRVHGFGVSNLDMMQRYPWYSVDTAVWSSQARAGNLLTLPDAHLINVADDSPQRKTPDKHIDTLPPYQREAVETRLRHSAIDLTTMRTDPLPRLAYNIWAYDQMGKIYFDADPKFKLDQPGLF